MLIRKDNLWSRAQNLLHAQSKKSVYKLHLSIRINSSKFSVYFTRKNLLFLVYTSTFTKHLHQFIYSTHLFNKIFIILLIFIIHSLTVPLSHRPTATITTIITTQPPSPHIPRSAPINPDLHASTPPRLHTYPDQRQ